MTEKEIDEVDGALWGLTIEDNMVECETTVYKFNDKITPMNEEIGSYNRFYLFVNTQPDVSSKNNFVLSNEQVSLARVKSFRS